MIPRTVLLATLLFIPSVVLGQGFRAGFARMSITPELPDTWTDADGNSVYQPDQGDTFEDGNGNGTFDAVWLAGFHQNRPAQAVHDSIYAIATVLDDGETRLAVVVLDAIGFFYDDVADVRAQLPAAWSIDHTVIASTHSHEVPEETIPIPLQNQGLAQAAQAGLIDRTDDGSMTSEINLITLGEAWIVTIPGEIYPEIINGGIETPAGADFPSEPVEVPPIRAMMRGGVNLIFGLANDEIGYIIPKSEWDVDAPYLYDADKAPYGEVVSPGPDTAPVIHRAVQRLIAQAPPAEAGALREALTFHASFDGGHDAAFALGDPKLYTAPSWDDRASALPRLPMAATTFWNEGGGRFGDALSMDNYEEMIFFFKADKNIAYRAENWSGTVSFWLRIDPDEDLKPGEWSDPIQITPRSWDDASLFVDFTREGPRQFRFAAFADTKVWNPDGENWWEMPDGAMPMISIADPPFSRDAWTHVVMTFDHFNTGANDGVLTAYLNGQRVGELTGREQTLTWDPAQALIQLGLQYVGDFDDLAFFNRALTDAEVKALFELDGGVASLFP